MKRRNLLALAAALLCAPALAWAQPSQRLPPPTPSDVSVHIGAADNGRTLVVPPTARFAVELVGVPTAGYLWTPVQLPPFLTRAGDVIGPTIAEQRQPGFAGGQHWEVLMFAPVEPGEGELVLVQMRPGAPGDIVDVFRVTITAQ